ncbi:MAG: hypothetical protein JWN57_2257, partial [Frankiales bacterium]|nr:hypothetical protein [Frankiales bacterium]
DLALQPVSPAGAEQVPAEVLPVALALLLGVVGVRTLRRTRGSQR